MRARVIVILAGLALVAILIAFATPYYNGETYSKQHYATAYIGELNSALALYRVDVADTQFPKTTLMQLLSDNAPGWSGPYMATITNDPWNNQYIYTSDGVTYTIQSIHKSDPAYNKTDTIRYCFGTGIMETIPGW